MKTHTIFTLWTKIIKYSCEPVHKFSETHVIKVKIKEKAIILKLPDM